MPDLPTHIVTAIVPCRDMDASTAFYERLGLVVASDYGHYRILTDGRGWTLHLNRSVPAGWLVPGRNPFGLYLYDEDVDAVAARVADAIARRSRYLRDFAHAVSHEFKTPLASIRGTIEILEDHGPAMSAAERRQFHANIAQDAARLDRLVARLLDLARADMTEIDTAASSDLASVVHRVADAYRATGIAVTVDLAEALPPIALPGAMLETILDSLIDNSRQAGAARIDLHAHLSGSRIELAVADDGPGIPAGDRARIFEPFFTARRASGGTGLGLPIARSLLSAHHGSIVLSDSPSGATFILRLPLRA